MRLVWLLLLLIVSIQAELILKPQARVLKKNVGESLVLTCEWEDDEVESEDDEEDGGGDDDDGGEIKWYDAAGNEVVNIDSSTSKFIEADNGHTKKLYLNHIKREDGGDYRCEREGGSRMKETQHIKLIIFKEISFEDATSPQNPARGTDALITCKATAFPEPAVSWQFKKKKLGTGKRTHRYKQTDEGLIIRNISEADNGVYLCRAEVAEEAMFDEKKITVEVHVPPMMTEGLGSGVEGVEGDEMVIACKADAYPDPVFHFYKGDDKILEANDRIRIDQHTASLTFSPLLEEDEGAYRCKAVNDVGDAESSGDVVVLVKPSITFTNVTVVEGQPVHLDCSARAKPSANFSFSKLDHVLTVFKTGENERGLIAVYSNGNNSMRLTIKAAQTHHTGSYKCHASNKAGDHEAVAHFSVEYKPRFPEDQPTELYIWAGKTKNITCLVSSVPPPSISWYRGEKVVGADDDAFDVFDLHDSVSVLQISATDENLDSLMEEVSCVAVNKYGSESFGISVKEATAPEAPADVNITETYSTGFLLTITPPDYNGGQDILGYEVDCEAEEISNILVKIDSESSSDSHHPVYNAVQPIVLSLKDNQLRVTNLQPNTAYVLKVRGHNEVGSGEAVSATATTLNIRKPFPIRVTEVEAKDYSKYLVKWHEPNTGGKPINQYEVSRRQNEESWWVKSFDVKVGSVLGECLMEGLLPNTSYQVKVRARNEIGWSDDGPVMKFDTREMAPHEAMRLSRGSFMYGGAIFLFILIAFFFLFLLIDLCCYYFIQSGVTHHVVSKLRGQHVKSSEKERVVEEGEKECLKGKEGEEVIKASIVYETIDENGQKVDLNKEMNMA